VEIGNEKLFTVILRDITEKLKSEKSIKASNERLHALAAHLQTIREDERKMLSREIHDQLGQELTALKIDISLLGKKIKKMEPGEITADIMENLDGMDQLTEHTINTVRRIAKELRPDMLDKLGLKEAVIWHAEDFEKRTGIKCLLTFPEEFGFGGNMDTTIFRIIQESLTNVARHSGANEVKVMAEKNDKVLKVIISDNGRGIMEDEIKNTKSLGLLGIRERAYSEGGTLEIESGNGTRLILTIPFK
jgi:signal transduction histidine kinase